MNSDVLKRLPGRALWRLPRPFGVAQVLRTGYSLRCVLFHDVSERLSTFTNGLGVTMTPRAFEETLRFLVRHYTPVSLEEALNLGGGRRGPQRPVLVTFDDAYASVGTYAEPLCRLYGIPPVFFVNGRFLGNREPALDNLVCHVVNTRGFETVNAIASEIVGRSLPLKSLRAILGTLVPSLTLDRREAMVDLLAAAAGGSRPEIASAAGLYLTADQLRALSALRFEIGNHTYSHVHGRVLTASDLAGEVDRNRVLLESITGTAVRSFSVPYGSSRELTPQLGEHLERSGYQAVFVVERKMNTAANARRFHRISIQPGSDGDLFSELEVLPRLRALRSAIVRPASTARSH